MGNNPLLYLQRVLGLITASFIFWPLVAIFMWRLTRADANARAERGGLRRTLRFLFISPGALRHAIGEWFDSLKPGFHPWQHHNRQYLSCLDPLLHYLALPALPPVALRPLPTAPTP